MSAQGSLIENMDRERSYIEVEVYSWMTKSCIWHSQHFYQNLRENVYYQSYVTPFRIDLLWKLYDLSFKINECAKLIVIYRLKLC